MTTVSGAVRRLGPKELAVLERIARSGRAVVRIDRDRHMFGDLGANSLRLVLKGLADGGWLRRLEKGVYVVIGLGRSETVNPLAVVADWLDGERYVISGFFALAHWNLTGHPPTRVDVLLARRRLNLREQRVVYRFIYVPTNKLPVAREVRVPGARALAHIVSPELALVGVLSGRHAIDIETAAEAFERGMRFRVLSRKELARVMRTAPQAAVRRLGWIAERRNDPLAKPLRELVGPQGYVALDPKAPSLGAPRNSRWAVLENTRELT